VIMQPVIDAKNVKNGAIVAAHVSGKTTLKYYHKKGSKVTLMPGNPDRTLYPETELRASEVELQGLLIAVWRDYK
jgi:repressor LexA